MPKETTDLRKTKMHRAVNMHIAQMLHATDRGDRAAAMHELEYAIDELRSSAELLLELHEIEKEQE